MQNTVLILGARGRFGLATASAFADAGWRVIGQTRPGVYQSQGWIKPERSLKIKNLPWAVIRLGAKLVPTWSALLEMRYLWEMPHALVNAKLTALIGPEPHTPLVLAVEAALADLGLMAASPLCAVARCPEATLLVQ